MYANIIVDVSAKQVNRAFTYIIPEEMKGLIDVGCRVIVPFNHRKIMGIVVGITDKYEENYELKEIIELLDLVPVLNKEMLEIGYDMVNNNTGFLIEAFKTIIPSSLLMKYKKSLVKLNDNKLNEFFISDKISYDDIPTNLKNVLKEEIVKKNIEIVYEAVSKEKILSDTYVKLNKYQFDLPNKQQEIVDYLLKNDDVKKSEILEKGYSLSSLQTLTKKEIVSLYKKEKYRQIKDVYEIVNKKVDLNFEQQSCYDSIYDSLGNSETFLLHGVTGSGKTEIYLDIIEEVLNRGQNAIFLVPEISLTPQMVSRVKGRFLNNVAVFHSGLSSEEKYDEWRRIFRDEVRVVVGARSAIFVPLNNLGIIIIDEEHEQSYKQDNGFRYNSKDVALFRSKYHSCPLVLGSATPDVISYDKALKKEYKLLEIKKRANQSSLPKIHLVNMIDELNNGNKTMFSNKLDELIIDRLNKKEQIILLINRRGYSSFVLCRSCGEVIKCDSCDVSMTYHKHSDSLMCHYCGIKKDKPIKCPKCGSPKIKEVGVGTEQVSEYVKARYNARVLRMDADTTTNKNAHAEILNQFQLGEADVLVGTQMISKGLDFKNVTLVGMLMADMILKLPDYRNSERTYQLIMQVAGRCGRHEKNGDVVVQGYNTDHYSITSSLSGNYVEFYENEMRVRNMGKYPPYVKMTQILITHKDYKEAFKRAREIVKELKSDDCQIFGPAFAPITKIKDNYRVHIMIKSKSKIDLLKILEKNQDINIYIDNDPILI